MRITKRDLRRLIREQREKLLVEAPTVKDLRADLARWKSEMMELVQVAEYGNLETADMGGLTLENSEEFSVELHSIVDMITNLELSLDDFEEFQREDKNENY